MPTPEQVLAISEKHKRKTQCLTEIMALKAEYVSLHQTLVLATSTDTVEQD
jgi:hypothetical protein